MKLSELIQERYSDLSKSQKKVATYVLDNPRKIALDPAQDVGDSIGVSETTVIRFCYSLELSGYAELQKAIREQLLSKESSLDAYQQSKMDLEQQPHFLEEVMERDRSAISTTMKQIDEKHYETAVEKLAKADTVYILGLRSSFAAAHWLTFTLNLVRGKVRQIRPETEDIIQILSEMDSNSVLIAISFHRYLKQPIRIAELAKQQGVFIIGVTDSQLAPIQQHSDVLFPIYSPNKSTLDATATLFSFLNALVAGVVVKGKGKFRKRQEDYQALDSDSLFMEGGDRQ
ncbi:MurR/RpiR family transcriptional regulator [Planococcus shenhongbingii]|uniref:MurR/RpiR family transcriptional regulator n=1 Tax=Planococcus shenhongbingii TaxID=3058398 RepID=UPI0026270F75|nr:MurR/RpiR family transcriptional regulator [Planococcus sp. N016]WKA56910.1 MurR/RpiR family transcriptional regulator [Planococcus sp. N016]